MLKHVSVTPWRTRSDSVSLASSGGASSCGSGSPSPGHTPPPSRASSCASLAPLNSLSSLTSSTDPSSQQVSNYTLIILPTFFCIYIINMGSDGKIVDISHESECYV